jgi:hypothetical protein
MNNKRWTITTFTLEEISKPSYNDDLLDARVITFTFTTTGIILATRKPTRVDAPPEVKRYGKLKKSTILELQPIIKEEYGLDLEGTALENFAYRLVGYFDVLEKAEQR